MHGPNVERTSPHNVVYDGLHRLLDEHAADTNVTITVAAVARLFSVSRPSAERALGQLVERGTLEQTPSGKFRHVASRPDSGLAVSLEELVQAVPEVEIDATRQRGSWLQLYDAVQSVVVQTAPSGR